VRKFMLLLFVAALATLGAAFAQPPTLVPTTGGGGVQMTDPSSAFVTQYVNVHIPVAYGIAIDDAANLNFDLSQISGKTQIICVSALATTDLPQETGGVWPLGTHYVNGETFGNISIIGGPQVTSYPPITQNEDTSVNVASKADFVCYRSFILEKFANTPGWDVTVTRNDEQVGLNSTPMYIQDNVCTDTSLPTAMNPLGNGDTVSLFGPNTILASYGQETTGAAVAAYNDANPNSTACGATSWLNDLVVVGIKVDGNQAGTFTSDLTYTIQALAEPTQLAGYKK
jgi:hypothetical protein